LIEVRRWHQGTLDDLAITTRLESDRVRSNAALAEVPE
jgi:hypothetical protein